ncbi:hypothetical protein [Providencia sp. PROV174]|uniref:hypothetical protein n=1 Tax=Providencia sp. PROV174 TaxID=2949877 RepID=UPI00234B508F|nr:hypothetical protein [Providencia sp. PROV174]
MNNDSFSEQDIDNLWEKALFTSHINEIKGFRLDEQGHWIRRSEYGNLQSEYGWLPLSITSNKESTNIDDFIPSHWSFFQKKNKTQSPKYRLKLLSPERISSEQIHDLWLTASKHTEDNEQKGYRVDILGHWVGRDHFLNRDSPFGWCAVLVDDINDKRADKQIRILPINLHLMQSLLSQIVQNEQGWTAWDTAELTVDMLDFSFSAIGDAFSDAITVPFSIFDL